MYDDIDKRIEELSVAIAYDGVSATAPARELRAALKEIKLLRGARLAEGVLDAER